MFVVIGKGIVDAGFVFDFVLDKLQVLRNSPEPLSLYALSLLLTACSIIVVFAIADAVFLALLAQSVSLLQACFEFVAPLFASLRRGGPDSVIPSRAFDCLRVID